MRSLAALRKWIASFLKRTWTLEDYPIDTRLQRTDPSHTSLPKYAARIVNWWAMVGLGETEEQARASLRQAVTDYARRHPLPRPGVKVPIRFASTDRISQFEELATDFFPAILRHEYSDCLVTDESSLMDFGGEWEWFATNTKPDKAMQTNKGELSCLPTRDDFL